MGSGTTDIFEKVLELTSSDVIELVNRGDTATAQTALEYWRSQGDWNRMLEVISSDSVRCPADWEVYLAEYDALEKERGTDPDYIPMTTAALHQKTLDNLTAPARYYFSAFTNRHIDVQKKRSQLREYQEKNPDRSLLWDVLYAGTFKVRGLKEAKRVYELCRPAVRKTWETVDDSETGNLAVLISLRAALAAKDIEMIRKSLAILWPQISESGSEENYTVLVNLRASDVPDFDPGDMDKTGTDLTTVLLSRLYRDLCHGKDLTAALDQLEAVLDDWGWYGLLGGASVTIRFSYVGTAYAAPCSITDDILCDLIRLQQGPLDSIATDEGRRLAALCHAIGGVASAGLGKNEANTDIRHLTESQQTHWAHRGIAWRILQTKQYHLLGTALKQLQQGYQYPGLSQNRADPFDLWLLGTDMLVREFGQVLRWVLSLEHETAFNQAMWDIVYPTLWDLREGQDEDEAGPVEHEDGRIGLLVKVTQSPLLDHRCSQIGELIESIAELGRPREAIALAQACIETAEDPDTLIIKMTEIASQAFGPRQALEIIEPYGVRLTNDTARNTYTEHEEALHEALSGDDQADTQHWMLFDPAVPPCDRVSLFDQEIREVFQLGAAASFLESPTGQSLLLFQEVDADFGAWSDDWPRVLKNLLTRHLLRIRPDGPDDSFSIDEEQRINWIPAFVDLAVNVEVAGEAGKSQSGIILSLPAAIRRYVLETKPTELLSFWRALIRDEAEAYYFSCLAHFRLPMERVGDEKEMFQGVSDTYSLSDLMNLIYNACQSAAGEQKAKGLTNPHTRNMAKKMVRSRIERARDQGWNIRKGYRSDLFPASHMVRYFSNIFLPLGETVYEGQVPNVEAVASALEALKVSG